MIWMLAGVVVTAALTATIVTIASGTISDDGTCGPVRSRRSPAARPPPTSTPTASR
jgi:hypothetical protein